MNEHPFYYGYYHRHGVVTPEVYAAARQLSGDREFRWEDEKVRLAGMPIRNHPSSYARDEAIRLGEKKVIDIWEAALAECREEFGGGGLCWSPWGSTWTFTIPLATTFGERTLTPFRSHDGTNAGMRSSCA